MCDAPCTLVNKQETILKVIPYNYSIPIFARRLLPLFLLASSLASRGLLGSKKKNHGLPGFIVFNVKGFYSLYVLKNVDDPDNYTNL